MTLLLCFFYSKLKRFEETIPDTLGRESSLLLSGLPTAVH